MGNAAGLVADQHVSVSSHLPREPTSLAYKELERICQEGYFMNEHNPVIAGQYREAVEVSIQKGYLDNLECLIPAGRIRKVYPFHLAAKYANLECLELLNSAGFNPELTGQYLFLSLPPLPHCKNSLTTFPYPFLLA